MSRVDVIANERLLDDRHHWHEFQDFWAEGPVALVFLRQFGSAFALQQAREISARYDDITATGGTVVFIGLGTPIQGFTFRQRAGSRFTVLATADQTLYRTMGLSRTRTGQTIGSAKAWLSLIRIGVRPYQATGDSNQLGGVFITPRGGRTVSWESRSHRLDHLVPAHIVVEELRRTADQN